MKKTHIRADILPTAPLICRRQPGGDTCVLSRPGLMIPQRDRV
jgi:hypothetical protein